MMVPDAMSLLQRLTGRLGGGLEVGMEYGGALVSYNLGSNCIGYGEKRFQLNKIVIMTSLCCAETMFLKI